MQLGGLQKTSLIDYPNKISCIVWTIGCNFRCPYCYNKELVLGNAKKLDIEGFFAFLDERQNILDGVVITGGEPLIQDGLVEFIKKIKSRGYLVKIDTNGTKPRLLKSLITKKLVDYIAMDLKAAPHRYDEITGVKTDNNSIKQSINIIINSKVDHEFRTTVVPGLITKEDVESIAKMIKGARKYCIQNFFKTETLSEKFTNQNPYSDKQMEEIYLTAKPYIEQCILR